MHVAPASLLLGKLKHEDVHPMQIRLFSSFSREKLSCRRTSGSLADVA